MSRTLVIGDIHGGLKALIQVLQKAAIQPNDILVFLGDYVDGWSESPAVLDFLIALSEQQNCIFIKGNHDELLLDWLENRHENLNEKQQFMENNKEILENHKRNEEKPDFSKMENWMFATLLIIGLFAILLSIFSWSQASTPTNSSAIFSFTFFTAFRTLLPLYRDLSPSLNSKASKDPVEAPDGTAALPKEPSERITSTSTVGFPLLSII